MKKILFVTPINPELVNTGDKKYSWDILRTIKHGSPCFLHVVAYYEKEEDACRYYKLASLADKVTYVPFKSRPHWKLAFSRYPGMIASRKKKTMTQAITKILEKEQYDAIMVNMFKMSFLIDTIKKYSGKKINITHNVEHLVSKSTYKYSKGLWKFVFYLDYLKTRYWEKKYIKDYDVVTTICDNDKNTFSNLGWCKTLFTLRPIVQIDSKYEQRPHTNTAIVCGTFTWTPKRINLLKLIKSSCIDLFRTRNKKLIVVGRANPNDVEYLNKIANITATGFVESVEPFYEKAEVVIVPEMAGGGFKLKITEAVQHHLPIVALKEAITDDIIESDIHYLAANDFNELIQKAIALIDDRDLQSQLVRNATSLFETEYSISKVNQTLFQYL